MPPPLDPKQAQFYARYLEHTHPITGDKSCGPWVFQRCGQRVTVYYLKPPKPRRHVTKRGEIGIFTKQARFRMLKRIAEINWERVGPSMFLTLTYPDSVAHNCKDKRNTERYLFLRATEMYLGKRVCGLWRVEYKPRLSGAREGEVLSHIHMILFGVSFVPVENLRSAWQSAIGCDEVPRVHVERCGDGLKATRYIAKYVGKVEQSAISLFKSHISTTGRHYGYHRARDIPYHPTIEFPLLDPACIHFIRVRAQQRLRYLDLDYFETFTLLGEIATKISKVVEKNVFDIQGELSYDE